MFQLFKTNVFEAKKLLVLMLCFIPSFAAPQNAQNFQGVGLGESPNLALDSGIEDALKNASIFFGVDVDYKSISSKSINVENKDLNFRKNNNRSVVLKSRAKNIIFDISDQNCSIVSSGYYRCIVVISLSREITARHMSFDFQRRLKSDGIRSIRCPDSIYIPHCDSYRINGNGEFDVAVYLKSIFYPSDIRCEKEVLGSSSFFDGYCSGLLEVKVALSGEDKAGAMYNLDIQKISCQFSGDELQISNGVPIFDSENQCSHAIDQIPQLVKEYLK